MFLLLFFKYNHSLSKICNVSYMSHWAFMLLFYVTYTSHWAFMSHLEKNNILSVFLLNTFFCLFSFPQHFQNNNFSGKINKTNKKTFSEVIVFAFYLLCHIFQNHITVTKTVTFSGIWFNQKYFF